MSITKKFRASTAILISVVVVASLLLPLVSFRTAHAYGLVTSRSITMNNASGAATGVNYAVSFTTATASIVAGMVVDFCSNDPIIGDSCTAPSGFTAGSSISSVTTPGQTGLTWSGTSANTGRTIELTTTGTVSGSVAASSTITFNITNVTNPTATNTTFYARVFTFATTGAPATWVSAASNGSSTTGVVDAGGIALSTSQSITVTAKVQEQLTFCVGTLSSIPTSGGTPTAQTSCGNLPNSAVTLGNNNGVLSSSGPYVDTSTQYIVGTNAQGGAAIVLKGAPLTSGSGAVIPGIGVGTGTAAVSSTGTSQFGLCTYVGTGSNLVFTNETSTSYADATCNSSKPTQSAGYSGTGGAGTAKFAYNTTATNSASGDPFALENAGANSTGIVNLLGNISSTQTAGIYTTTLSFIATGTY